MRMLHKWTPWPAVALSAILMVAGLVSAAAPVRAGDEGEARPLPGPARRLVASAERLTADRPRNVIVMISDGMGYNHAAAANLYVHGETGRQVYEGFPFQFAMSTYSAGGDYNPREAWADFDYVKHGYTDSAAAGTVLSTGVKTYNGAIGVGPDRKPLKHAMERAEELGKATGVVTSVQLSHATPAGFAAHNVSRSSYAEIAEEMIQRSMLDVIMGCGHPFYTNDGAPTPDGDGDGMPDARDYRYVGGEETWRALREGTAGTGVDADHNDLADDAWTLIETRAQFRAYGLGAAPKRLIGVPRVANTLQQRRSGERNAEPFAVPFIETVPTLEEMTRAALNVLEEDPDGFVMMVEGGAVDWASHSNQSGRMVEEQIDFNLAVNAVVEWVETESDWSETLLIVTADHECGYLTRESRSEADVPWTHEPLRVEGPGRMPGIQWNSGSHTNSLVPIYARGTGTELLARYLTEFDPVRGPYLDNTAVGRVLFAAMR